MFYLFRCRNLTDKGIMTLGSELGRRQAQLKILQLNFSRYIMKQPYYKNYYFVVIGFLFIFLDVLRLLKRE